jgi:hypothetical protein
MKLLNILCLIAGIAISFVAAYFSIVGLAAIFAATFIPVIIMGSVLEFGKIVAATWLHHNWKNSFIGKWHKIYMCLAIAVLMLITSLGIYGFLSKGHLEQKLPVAGIELQIQQKEMEIAQIQSRIDADNTRLKQLDSAVDNMISKDRSTQALRYRNTQKAERAEIVKNQKGAVDQINQLNADLLPLKQQVSETEAKLGPVKYVAELFGIKDTEGAVRIIIVLIMIAFDPLALMLIISSTKSNNKPVDNSVVEKELITEPIEENDNKIDLEPQISDNTSQIDIKPEDYKSWL